MIAKQKGVAVMIGKAAKIALAAGALALSPAAPAQDLSPALQALDAQLPGDLINDPSRLDWATQGIGFKSKGVADPTIPGGGAAVQFEIRKADPKPYTIQAFVPLLSKIGNGETVTIGFYARALSADTADGQGVINVRFQQNSDPWPGFGDATVKIGPEWGWHEVSAVSNINVAKEVAVVALQLAGAKQTVQIGQAIVVKGASVIQGSAATPASAADVLSAAAELPDPLKNVGRLVDRPELRNWADSGPPGSYVQRDDGTIWLGKATRYSVAAKGQNRWDVGTSIPIGEAIAEGDKLVIAFAAKTVSASTTDGKALVGVRVQSSDPPYDGFADHLVAVGPNWQLVRLNTTATKAIPAGKATVALQFAEAAQVVDIGPVYVFKAE
jgi:hypothetical protein